MAHRYLIPWEVLDFRLKKSLCLARDSTQLYRLIVVGISLYSCQHLYIIDRQLCFQQLLQYTSREVVVWHWKFVSISFWNMIMTMTIMTYSFKRLVFNSSITLVNKISLTWKLQDFLSGSRAFLHCFLLIVHKEFKIMKTRFLSAISMDCSD